MGKTGSSLALASYTPLPFPLLSSIVPFSSELRQAFPSASPLPVFCLPSLLLPQPPSRGLSRKEKERASPGRWAGERPAGCLGLALPSSQLCLGPAGALGCHLHQNSGSRRVLSSC